MRERRDGMGTTGLTVGRETVGKGADSGTGNSRDGNKTPYDGMVDGGNRNQRPEGSGNRGRERKITRFLFPSRPVPVPTFAARITEFYEICENGEDFVSASGVK